MVVASVSGCYTQPAGRYQGGTQGFDSDVRQISLPGTKKPRQIALAGLSFSGAYRPAAARRSAALSVRSQVKVVKLSSPTVLDCGVRPKWP